MTKASDSTLMRTRIKTFLLENIGKRYNEAQLGQRFGLTGRSVKRTMTWLMNRDACIVSSGGNICYYSAIETAAPAFQATGDLVGYTENLFRMAETRMALRGGRWRLDKPIGWRPGQVAT